MKRTVYSMFLLFAFLITGCSGIKPQESSQPEYQSYKEIPTVTQEEIAAIEALKAKKTGFVYGFPLSTEAFYENDGTLNGFTTLLFGRMSELFGFDFIPVACEWNELVAKVDSGEIDFTSEFSQTPERLSKYLMTTSINQRVIKVFSNINNDDLNTLSKKRAIRCGFLKGSNTYSIVESSWNIPFEPVFIDGESLVVDYFLNDKIDAYIAESVMESIFARHDFIKSDEYYPLHYSPVSLTTGNLEFKPIIDVMQKYLENGGLSEIAELHNIGMNEYLKHRLNVFLTDEEKEYIKNHSSDDSAIMMAVEAENYPSCFFNPKDNEFQGTAIDMLKQISDLTGLKFEQGNETNDSWAQLLEDLENGKYSIVTELLQTNNRKGRFLWSEDPYYMDNYVLISRLDYPYVDINQIPLNKVGLLEGAAYTDVFLEWFPDNTNTLSYVTIEEACKALESGEIDLLMSTQNLLLYITNCLEKPGFKANLLFNYSTGSYFGFNKDEEILKSIVSKAQRCVDTLSIAERWKRRVFDYNSKVLKDMLPYAVGFSVLILAALFIVIVLFMKNKRISKNLEAIVLERTNELELQTSTLTTIFKSIPDLIFCKDLDSNFTRCNKSVEEHFGRSEASIIGKNEGNGFGLPHETVTYCREIDKRVLEECRPITVEEVIPAADGSLPLFETIKIPLLRNDKPVGILGISRNITQRKVAEETLKLTLDNLNTFIYINEIDTGKILFINERMAKEFGRDEYYGKTCWDVLQEGFTERCSFCPVPKILESGVEYLVWEEHNTVTNRHYRNTDSIIKWHDGRLVHMQHSSDITEAVKLQRDLEHASRAKGDFLARMSHEIRTPLNAIIGMNNIALNSDDLAKAHQCHEKIDNASKHLLGVINDILDMSKIEADKFELSNSEFDFENMLINITNVTNFKAEEKHQELVVNIDKDVPLFVFSDELRLSQVITNLLSNAVKFTPERGLVLLNVKKMAENGENVTLQIEIVDNGIGISEEQQKRLFTSFEQADGGISRKFGGTGLGLAISKRIIELMGGKIWIESRLSEGSKFAFTINVKSCKEKLIKKLSSKIDKNNIRILAVDDAEETRICFSHVMEAHGLPCDVASGGTEALEMLENCGDKPYNIFFVDWQMPEMDGIELTKKIKEITGDNAVVFMISVADWNFIEKEAVSAGVNSFIPKPLFPSSLINAINECLGTESARAESRMKVASEKPDFRSKSVLIAEDIEINREIMVAILEDVGISIDFAENGQSAVSTFLENNEKYDLVLMDIHMPEMDGYEATRLIRAMEFEWAKKIPIIAMTANVFREDIENCLAAGMNDHIGKPIDSDDLFDKLEKYLG